MAKFLSNLSGIQTLILIFGMFMLLIGSATLFPEAYARVFASIGNLFTLGIDFFRNLGGTQ